MDSNSESGVFLMSPLRVASIRKRPSRSSGSGNTVCTFSPGTSCNRLMIALPLEVLLASGIS